MIFIIKEATRAVKSSAIGCIEKHEFVKEISCSNGIYQG